MTHDSSMDEPSIIESTFTLRPKDRKVMMIILAVTIFCNLACGILLFIISQLTQYSVFLFVIVITTFVTITCQIIIAISFVRYKMTFPIQFEYYMAASILMTLFSYFITVGIIILHSCNVSIVDVVTNMSLEIQITGGLLTFFTAVVFGCMVVLFVYISFNQESRVFMKNNKYGYSQINNDEDMVLQIGEDINGDKNNANNLDPNLRNVKLNIKSYDQAKKEKEEDGEKKHKVTYNDDPPYTYRNNTQQQEEQEEITVYNQNNQYN